MARRQVNVEVDVSTLEVTEELSDGPRSKQWQATGVGGLLLLLLLLSLTGLGWRVQLSRFIVAHSPPTL